MSEKVVWQMGYTRSKTTSSDGTHHVFLFKNDVHGLGTVDAAHKI